MSRALRILLAEDNPGDVFLVREALKRHSLEHELTVAKDGQSAWQLIEAADGALDPRFDLFLLDLNLPVRPGLELLGRIRACKGDMSRALVLILTSSNWNHDRRTAVRDGADYYFLKPSTLDAFLQLGAIIRELWAARCGTASSGRLVGMRIICDEGTNPT
ncbi:MAG TPA: response regulator [Bryobacteraceae bacterium]|nr:response regulator [Bryobacteraceae bacterium]